MPVGTGSVVQFAPPLVVAITTGLPNMPNPTAMQSVVVAHETLFRPLTCGGMLCGRHA